MDLDTLEEQVKHIRLCIHQPGGKVRRIGRNGPQVDWHLHNPRSLRTILKRPELRLGSSYVRGDWDIDTRRLGDLVQALVPARSHPGPAPLRLLQRLRARLPRRRQPLPPHWQDTSVWLSRLCLGDELFQTCALYNEPGMSMEQAQRTRASSLLHHLQLRPGQQLLDLNAGWGSLAVYLARQAQVQVTGMVRTHEQLRVAQQAARRAGVEGRVRFRIGDLNQCRGHFDRILVSGSCEDLGDSRYPLLLARIEQLLHDDGFAWLQFASRSRNGEPGSRWTRATMLSAWRLPLLSRLLHELERLPLRTLLVEDQSAWRLRDLEQQARRFHRHRSLISRRFGERSTRGWEFQLASQATALRQGQLKQYELLLGGARSRYPLTSGNGHDSRVVLPPDIMKRVPGLAGTGTGSRR